MQGNSDLLKRNVRTTLSRMAKPLPAVISHLTKATGAIEISEPTGALTLADRRLFTHLLAHAYRDLGKATEHTIRLSTIRGFAAEARDGVEEAGNRRLKESIRRLQRTVVQFNYLESDKGSVWESSQFLGTCKIIERTGELTYTFPNGLAEKLAEPALYSYISLQVMYQFESKYAFIIYEILKRYSDRDAADPYWAVKTSELRDILGCRDRLKDWKDFRRRAIDPAVSEIAQLSEFALELDEIRQGGGRGGGRVVGVVFRIRRKSRSEAEAAARELEKPKFQRRGERKLRDEDAVVAKALRWMETADYSTRVRWEHRAQDLGVMVPKGGAARENLAKWVPAIARMVCEEEMIR
jgi:plasmid replication initiation protein